MIRAIRLRGWLRRLLWDIILVYLVFNALVGVLGNISVSELFREANRLEFLLVVSPLAGLGALVLLFDAQRELYPLREWRTNSQTAETQLAREGLDYRGVQVLAAWRAVPCSACGSWRGTPTTSSCCWTTMRTPWKADTTARTAASFRQRPVSARSRSKSSDTSNPSGEDMRRLVEQLTQMRKQEPIGQLAMVFGIARQHGGKIEVSSTPGQGTEVRIFFPLVRMSTAE